MNVWDIVLIAVIAACVVCAVFLLKKRGGGCGCGCPGCTGKKKDNDCSLQNGRKER